MKKSLMTTVFAVVLLAALPCAGEDAPDPKEIVTEAMAYVAALDSLTVEISVAMRAQVDGREQSVDLKTDVALRGADDLYFHVNSGASEAEVYSTSEKHFIHVISDKEYVEEEPFLTRTELLGMVAGGAMRMGTQWFSRFVHRQEGLLDEYGEAEYLGKEELVLNGGEAVDCHHLKLASPQSAVELWLEASERPFLHKLVMDVTGAFFQTKEQQESNSVTIELVTSAWQPGVQLDDARFAFVPPEGVKRMPSKDERATQEPQDPLLGKEAPAIELDLLDGGKMNLANHKGKEVVILDFWATWCSPCRMAMPIIAQVASEYKDKGVVLYAVNQREDEAKIRSFLESSKLSLNVALDKDSKAGAAYRVSGIPRMVIVGKDGIVHAGHSGMSPTLKTDLKRELDEILALKIKEDESAEN